MDNSVRNEVLQWLNTGAPEKATQLVKPLLDAAPDDADANSFYGIALLMGGDAAAAAEWLERANGKSPNNPVYLCNLGVACLRAKRAEEAVTHLTRALELRPDYPQAQYSLGSAYIAHKQPDKAIPLFQSLCKQDGTNPDYICALADAVRETGQWKKALPLYRKALTLAPGFARAHTNLGPMLAHFGQPDEALEHCRKAVELTPESALAHKNLGDCLLQIDQLDEAMDAYADAFERDPENAPLCVAIGRVWQETNHLDEAHVWFQKAQTVDAENVAARCGIANVIKEAGDEGQALELLRELHQEHPDDIDVCIALADALWDTGDATAALELLNHVKELQPQRLAIHGKIGHILSSSGDVPGAVATYQTALDENPRCIPALNGMATTQRGKLEPDHVRTMEAMLASDKLRSGARGSLHNGLAFYYDGVKDAEKTALHTRESNRLQWENRSKRGWSYSPEEYEEHISRFIETFDRAYFERLGALNLGNDSELPAFIVAMPRSGTTLTEQILARHSQVLGVGERAFASQAYNAFRNMHGGEEVAALASLKNEPDPKKLQALAARYLKQLTTEAAKSGKGGVTRVVDKMPDNYSLLGWILTLFPRAKIIHLKRDPRDVALSCWMTQFGAIRWACQIDHLTTRIQQYQRIMAHWRNVIPEQFMEFDYEELVANQEEVSKQLVAWLGLEWEPQCLEFYKSDRIVRTASITQVREPIYNRSVEKWRRYEPYLAELFAPLKP